MICKSCGGIIGRDCFNQEECAAIGQAQEQQQRQESSQQSNAIIYLLGKVADLEIRIAKLENKP